MWNVLHQAVSLYVKHIHILACLTSYWLTVARHTSPMLIENRIEGAFTQEHFLGGSGGFEEKVSAYEIVGRLQWSLWDRWAEKPKRFSLFNIASKVPDNCQIPCMCKEYLANKSDF